MIKKIEKKHNNATIKIFDNIVSNINKVICSSLENKDNKCKFFTSYLINVRSEIIEILEKEKFVDQINYEAFIHNQNNKKNDKTTGIKVKPDYFKQYKNIHKGQSAILFGSGPTLKQVNFTKIPKHLINTVLNSQIKINDIKIDYYFNGDAGDFDNGLGLTDIIENKKIPGIKFIGLTTKISNNWEEILGRIMNDCVYYKTKRDPSKEINIKNENGNCTYRLIDFEKNIDSELISRASSISFDALQFILYTGISKLYLVGQDNDYKKGAWDQKPNPAQKTNKNKLLTTWEKTAIPFIEESYPDVEIINVNPVALKPYFKSITLEELYNLKG
jgi:hypothetical protein